MSGITSQTVTDIVSEKFGQVADAMRRRKVPPPDVAHFVMKLMFSMFAEDIELLPNRVFSRTLKQSKNVPEKLSRFLRELFAAMASGGTFALEEILHFNGGLFADADVMVPAPSFVTVRAMTAVPLPSASALVMAGTSRAGERGTVNVDVVVVVLPCDGAVGDESPPHPTANMLRPMTSVESRFMLCCLSRFAQKNFRARLKPR